MFEFDQAADRLARLHIVRRRLRRIAVGCAALAVLSVPATIHLDHQYYNLIIGGIVWSACAFGFHFMYGHEAEHEREKLRNAQRRLRGWNNPTGTE
ncbi:hypothetical protein ACWDYH_00440 [Nocardia goodfellowii]